MRYQEDIQIALRDRFRRILQSDRPTYDHEVGLVVRWITDQPALRAVVDELTTTHDVDVDAWMADCSSRRSLLWPTTTEAARAALVWGFMNKIAEGEAGQPWQFAYVITHERNVNDGLRGMTEAVFGPLFDYLGERVGAESSVLYLLERYVRRVEWFERDELYEAYSADTQQGEKVYDKSLRVFLFDQGLNMPFSQPKSASGLSDVIGELDTDDPLVCEVKLFDAEGHGKRSIASGVTQALSYAQDYGKRTAFVVIFNLSGRALDVPDDGDEKAWPPYVEISGVRVHLITVRALPTVSASKMSKTSPVTVSRNDLIDPDI